MRYVDSASRKSVEEGPMTPGDLRAEIARRQLVRYHLAAEVGVHPARLGQMLLGKVPMPTEIVQMLTDALGRHEHEPVG
jgi:plasmid maintenance system antidote protein VapI